MVSKATNDVVYMIQLLWISYCNKLASWKMILHTLAIGLLFVFPTATPKAVSEIVSMSIECEDAFHTLLNSFPSICREDWVVLDLILIDGIPREISRQICEIYCLNPLKTAADICPGLRGIFEFVVGLCSENEKQESCLSTFLTLNQTFPPSDCPNNNTCTLDCTTQLNTTLHTIGCCFSMLNNTAYGDPNNTGPFEYTYWNQCGVPVPNVCEFGYSTALSRSNIVSTVTLLVYSLVFISLMVYVCILC